MENCENCGSEVEERYVYQTVRCSFTDLLRGNRRKAIFVVCFLIEVVVITMLVTLLQRSGVSL